MKNYVIDKCMNLIKNKCDFSDTKLIEIRYGLASLYLHYTKIIVIAIIDIILGIFKYFLVLALLFGFLRRFASGMHAKTSLGCWISSILVFTIIPYINTFIYFNIIEKVIICILGIILMFINSPADTVKRPIVNEKKRKYLKFLSVITVIIYSFLTIYLKNQMVVNSLLLSIILENILISRITYKIFNMPYDNYKRWEEYNVN